MVKRTSVRCIKENDLIVYNNQIFFVQVIEEEKCRHYTGEEVSYFELTDQNLITITVGSWEDVLFIGEVKREKILKRDA